MDYQVKENKADFNAVRLAVVAPEDVLDWSYGEVTKPETINYRTQKPERDGLFCERIFGPVKDINPHDSKLKGVRSREAAIDKHGELVTKALARRERMGHIELATPVAHIWFMRGTPSAISLLLDMTVKHIERVVYFASYVILKVDEDKQQQMLDNLEATTEAARQAIKLRYETAATQVEEEEVATAEEERIDNLTIEELARNRTKEIEELEEDYKTKKSQLQSLVKMALITETEYRNLPDDLEELIEVGMGGRAIKRLLDEIDVKELIKQLEEEAETAKGQRHKKLLKRLKVIESMDNAGIKPSSLCLTILPVIPPDLRPMVSLAGGRFATSDLNDLYRRVINRNNRLKKLFDLNAPEVICRNEMRMLQEAVDSLIDNSMTKGSRTASSTNGRRKLKSLSDMLKGKQGRFRQNLLGKRVDYSGRSVIVVGPELKIDECGLPKQMALELFKPFVISWLIDKGYAHNIRSATRLIDLGEAEVWDALDVVVKDRFVLLNRAPTLHRLGVLAFRPKLIEGKAIQLHPLVTSGFNADFDGDQMAVHVPLSREAQYEAEHLMTAKENLLKPADGAPVLNIGQDVILGNYYLTYEKLGVYDQELKVFSSVYEAEMAYDAGLIKLQSPIRVFTKGEIRNTTLGRVYLNEVLPKDFPYQEVTQSKKNLKKVLAEIYDTMGAEATVETADKLKELSFSYATIAALSASKDDYIHYTEVDDMIKEGDKRESLISEQYDDGLITEDERYELTVENWRNVDREITDFLKGKLPTMDNSISMMVDSGARGTLSNIKLSGSMIGVMVDTTNREIELPVRSSYHDGISSLEAYVVTRGTRKGSIDTALKTADSGYLTRRLVDVAQDVFTIDDEASEDSDPGFTIYRSETERTSIELVNRIFGRFAAEDIKDYVKRGELITHKIAQAIDADRSVDSVKIMSVLSAQTINGIPRKSYGIDMATGELVNPHQPVGVIAAQSLGEPGTQLTLNTFHLSGVAGGDITQGLPRVEELLEARNPKGQAVMTEVSGVVEVWEDGNKYVVQVTPTDKQVEEIELGQYKPSLKSNVDVKFGEVLAINDDGDKLMAPFDGKLKVEDDKLIVTGAAGGPVRYEMPVLTQLVVRSGDQVQAGDALTIGSLNLQDLMRFKGVEATQRYIIEEILPIYATQGQDVADKHLEVIVKQMFSRVQIEEAGDSEFVVGDVVSQAAADAQNQILIAQAKQPLVYNQLLLGITKVSLYSDSFLSAASFQDTNRVLISAAISGRIDHLKGLKENVIIGHKIPVGTGAPGYELDLPEPEVEESYGDDIVADEAEAEVSEDTSYGPTEDEFSDLD